jgi:hypothetical protein
MLQSTKRLLPEIASILPLGENAKDLGWFEQAIVRFRKPSAINNADLEPRIRKTNRDLRFRNQNQDSHFGSLDG